MRELLLRRRMIIYEEEVPQVSGYTVIGSPTITDGIMVSGGANNGIASPVYQFGSNPWAIITRIKTPPTAKNLEVIFFNIPAASDTVNTSQRTIVVQRNNATSFQVFAGTGSSSWNVLSGAVLFRNLAANTWYTIKLEFTGTAYRGWTKTDTGQFVLSGSSNSATLIGSNQRICFGMTRNAGPYWSGSYDLKKTKIYIDGALWWRAI